MRTRNSRLLAVYRAGGDRGGGLCRDLARRARLADQRSRREHEVAGLRAGVGPVAGAPADRRRPGLDPGREPATVPGPTNVSYYGYDNDTLNSARRADHGRLQRDRQHGGAQDRAGQEHLPGLQEGPPGRRPELQLRHPLPLPGPRGRLARLHHADQPGRGREAPRDRAGDEGRPGQRHRHDRRLHLGSVGAAAPVHDRERDQADLLGHARLPVDGARRLRRARPRRLRGHPGRLGRQHLDRRGHRRRVQATRMRVPLVHDREDPAQLRLPLRPEDPGRPGQRQAAGAAGLQRLRTS